MTRNHSADDTPSGKSARLASLGRLAEIACWIEATTFKPGNVEDYAELDKTRSISQRLTSALRPGAKTAAELAEELDADEGSIRTTLNRNKTQFSTFKNDGQTYWGIAHREH